jgi:hypothetical protein
MGDASPADWESHSQLFLEGEAVTETTLAETSRPGGAIRSMGSYVIPLTIWTHGQRLHFRLVETWSRHPAFWASGGALPFLNPTVSVWAFPGIGADAPFCGGPFTGEAVELPSYFAVTRSECVYANLAISSEGWLDFSGWNQLYTFFTSTFEGSCIRISRSEERWPPPAGDWEEWANEDAWDVREGLQHRETRNVEIEFWFAGAPTNGEEMYRAMSSAGGYLTAEMTERATDVVYLRQYAFEWIGRRATLTEDFGSHIRFGGPHGSHGTVVLNLPDRLEMDFTAMVEDSWEGDHGVRRYLDLSYRLNRR